MVKFQKIYFYAEHWSQDMNNCDTKMLLIICQGMHLLLTLGVLK